MEQVAGGSGDERCDPPVVWLAKSEGVSVDGWSEEINLRDASSSWPARWTADRLRRWPLMEGSAQDRKDRGQIRGKLNGQVAVSRVGAALGCGLVKTKAGSADAGGRRIAQWTDNGRLIGGS